VSARSSFTPAVALASACTAFALAFALPTTALADEQSPPTPQSYDLPASGPRFGVRTGVARPIGSAFAGSSSMSDTIYGYVPVRLDAGYRIARRLYVGIDAQLGAIIPAGCTTGFSCSGMDTRLGIMVAYHLFPTKLVDPYIGVGTGYEILETRRSVGTTSVDITARGFELINGDLGADVRIGRSWRVGPVVSGSVARYTSVAVNGIYSTDFTTLLHAWAMVGVRGAFDL
jgi:hypothetical protein